MKKNYLMTIVSLLLISLFFKCEKKSPFDVRIQEMSAELLYLYQEVPLSTLNETIE